LQLGQFTVLVHRMRLATPNVKISHSIPEGNRECKHYTAKARRVRKQKPCRSGRSMSNPDKRKSREAVGCIARLGTARHKVDLR